MFIVDTQGEHINLNIQLRKEFNYHSSESSKLSINVRKIGIFILNGNAYTKELGNKCLISHNEKYKPISIRTPDSVYSCGRVLGVVKS